MGKGGKSKGGVTSLSRDLVLFCNSFKVQKGVGKGFVGFDKKRIWQDINFQDSTIRRKLEEVRENIDQLDSQAIVNFGNLLSASGNQALMKKYVNLVLNQSYQDPQRGWTQVTNNALQTLIQSGNSQAIVNFGNLLSASGDQALMTQYVNLVLNQSYQDPQRGWVPVPNDALQTLLQSGNSQEIANFGNLVSVSGNQALMKKYVNLVLNQPYQDPERRWAQVPNNALQTLLQSGNSQEIANFGNLLWDCPESQFFIKNSKNILFFQYFNKFC